MIFNPRENVKTAGVFEIPGEVNARAHSCLNKEIFKEFWNNFTFGASRLDLEETDGYVFSVGEAKPLPLDGCGYSINVEPLGIRICAADKRSLIEGFMTLLDLFRAVDVNGETVAAIDCRQLRDSAAVRIRMVHYCILPETELWELQRFLRFCGALKYTHVILEFWGMLKYDCMKELSWSHAFTKEQIRPIIDEAHALGLEIVPMFNHWGHASACRVMHGKHVVLDQNPSLQTYFSPDGWCWDIGKPKVRELLRNIRRELCELCGEGEYFHVGCDEAYNFDMTKEESMKTVCDYLNGISAELTKEGRRTITWGDMFLYKYPEYNPANRYACNAPSPESERFMLENLSRDIIIADWQYDSKEAPVETASVFTKAGFECLLCPWDRGYAETAACIKTIKEERLCGLIHTTWHTLSSGTPYVLLAAVHAYEKNCGMKNREARTYAAALLRKVMPSGGNYERSGWSRYQISFKW